MAVHPGSGMKTNDKQFVDMALQLARLDISDAVYYYLRDLTGQVFWQELHNRVEQEKSLARFPAGAVLKSGFQHEILTTVPFLLVRLRDEVFNYVSCGCGASWLWQG